MTIEIAVYDCTQCEEDSMSDEGAEQHHRETDHTVQRVKTVKK